jgi:hypothetical protein
MSENVPDTSETPVPERRRKGWGARKWALVIGAMVVALPAAAIFLWSVIALNWSYSEGERAGYVQKFSKKGWICKTWEGDLSMINIPGAAPERWMFTVRDDSVAQLINSYMGKQVSLHYEEHPGVPTSCFGDTRYYVTGVRPVNAPERPLTPP